MLEIPRDASVKRQRVMIRRATKDHELTLTQLTHSAETNVKAIHGMVKDERPLFSHATQKHVL